MKKLILFLSISFSLQLLSQTSNSKYHPLILPQGYGIKLLNSSGASSINNDVSNITFMNPASISKIDDYSLGVSYQLSSQINGAYIADIRTNRIYNFFPQSFGGVIKYEDFTFGLGFGQKYNGTLEYDPIPVTTFNNLEGTGEYFDLKNESIIQRYSFSIAFSLTKFLQTSNNLYMGFQYSLNRLHHYEELWNIKDSTTAYACNFILGLEYDLALDAERKLSLGISYETMTKFKQYIEYNGSNTITYDPDSGNISIDLPSYDLVYDLPSELRFDLAIDGTENLKLLANLTGIFWKNETNNLKDQFEYSLSSVYRINKIFSPSLGFYYTDYNFEQDDLEINGKFKGFYITAGCKINFEPFYLDLVLADSHLLSGDYRKQTIGKFAFGVQL